MRKRYKKLLILLSITLVIGLVFSNLSIISAIDVVNIKDKNIVDYEKVEDVKNNIDEPQEVADIINDINDTDTYEEALKTALDEYYINDDESSIEIIENNTDERADQILDNYENASNERKTDINDLGYMSGEVLAVIKSGITEKDIPILLEDERTNVVSICDYIDGKKLAKINISLEDTVDSAIEKMSSSNIVESVQKDFVYTTDNVFTEEVINDYYCDDLYYLSTISAPDAWDYIEGIPHEKIRVGIIDTGAQIDHPDLENVINKDLSVRISCDGIISPLNGDNGIHGTHVSGIVAAQANNNLGVAGVASAVNNDIIDLVEIGSDTGTGNNLSVFVIYKAIVYAIDNNIRVINMSLGGETDPDNIFQSAIDLAINSGCVVVCAAGNDNSSDYSYPSDCNGAISVIALDENCTKRASYSNYGARENKVSAPGTSILSTIPENGQEYNYKSGYEKLSGTSMATPVVVAEAAMILSVNPTLTSKTVKEIIYSTCDDMGNEGYDDEYGYGRVNIYSAVKKAYMTNSSDMPTAVKLSKSSVSLVKGDSVKISADVTSTGDNKSVYYHIEDSAVAKVSQDGVVTGVSCGETKLIVSTENTITASCVVKVIASGSNKIKTPTADEVQTGVYTGARINWNKVDNADYYQLYATTGDDNSFKYIGSTTLNSYAASIGLIGNEVPAANVTRYKVKAVSNSSSYLDSDLSDEFAYVYVGQEPYLTIDQLLDKGKDNGLDIHWSAIVSSNLYRSSSEEEVLLATFDGDMSKNYYEDVDVENGVTYTYRLELFTEYKGVKYSEISSRAVVEYFDDDPVDPSLGKSVINGVRFKGNELQLSAYDTGKCMVHQCLVSENDGKSWFVGYNSIGDRNDSFIGINGLEFGHQYLIKYKSFKNELEGLYRNRTEYSDTISVTMPEKIETVNVTASYSGGSKVNVKWTESSNASYYELYRKNKNTWDRVGNNIYGLSYIDTVTSGEMYYYMVIPVNADPQMTAVDSKGDSVLFFADSQLGDDSNIVKVNTRYSSPHVYMINTSISDIEDQIYTGDEICPNVSVVYDNTKLVNGKDYTVKYSSNIAVGTAYVTISGIGTYSGERCVPFNIVDNQYKYFTVTFKDYDGSVISEQKVKEGEKPQNVNPPYREGFSFSRWDKNITAVYSDQIINAKYVFNNVYFNVAFLDKDGYVFSRQKVAYGEGAQTPELPDYAGYEFVGWNDDYTCITKSKAIKPIYMATEFAGGDGSTGSPYLIENKEQLDLFSSLVNSSDEYANASYKLCEDIRYNDLANSSEWGMYNRQNENVDAENIWIPAGSEQRPFTGSFDGDGHVIIGLYIFTASDYSGFIGYAENATIIALKMSNLYLNSNLGYAGALVGKYESSSNENHRIHACCVEDSFVISNSVTGGIIGEFESKGINTVSELSDCYINNTYVCSQWDSIAGGLIGRLYSNGGKMKIEYCYSFVDLAAKYGNVDIQTGMLIGSFNALNDNNAWCTIKDCYYAYKIYDGESDPIDNYDELKDSMGSYTFQNIYGFDDYDDKTDPSKYVFKRYMDSYNSIESDNVWVFEDGKEPMLCYDESFYSLDYYLDDELISHQIYREGDYVDLADRYYNEDYISTDWVFDDEEFIGIMPAENVCANAQSYKCGDVDLNDVVDIVDVSYIQKYLASLDDLNNLAYLSSDANGDGSVNVLDCTEIQKYIAKYIQVMNGSLIPDTQVFEGRMIEKTIKITLRDETSSQWLSNDSACFFIVDNLTGNEYKLNYEFSCWKAAIPKSVSFVSIQRRNPETGDVWNSWTTSVAGKVFTVTNSGSNWS